MFSTTRTVITLCSVALAAIVSLFVPTTALGVPAPLDTQTEKQLGRGRSARGAIQVDGRDGDWNGYEPIITTTSSGHELRATEIRQVYATISSGSLYLMIRGAEPASQLDATRYEFWVDLDGDCRREYIFTWDRYRAWMRDLRWQWGKAYQFHRYQRFVENEQAREDVAEFRIPLDEIGNQPNMRLMVHTYVVRRGSTYTAWGTLGSVAQPTQNVGAANAPLQGTCITLDGWEEDWRNIPTLVDDPVHDTGMPVSDIRQVKAFTTQDALYVMIVAGSALGRSPNAIYCFYVDVDLDGSRDYNVGFTFVDDVGHYGRIWDLRHDGEPDAYSHSNNRKDLSVFTAGGENVAEFVMPLRLLEGATPTLGLSFFALRADGSPANPPTEMRRVQPLDTAPAKPASPPPARTQIAPTNDQNTPGDIQATRDSTPPPAYTLTVLARAISTPTPRPTATPTLPPTRTPTPTVRPTPTPTVATSPTIYDQLLTPKAWFAGVGVCGLVFVAVLMRNRNIRRSKAAPQ